MWQHPQQGVKTFSKPNSAALDIRTHIREGKSNLIYYCHFKTQVLDYRRDYPTFKSGIPGRTTQNIDSHQFRTLIFHIDTRSFQDEWTTYEQNITIFKNIFKSSRNSIQNKSRHSKILQMVKGTSESSMTEVQLGRLHQLKHFQTKLNKLQMLCLCSDLQLGTRHIQQAPLTSGYASSQKQRVSRETRLTFRSSDEPSV